MHCAETYLIFFNFYFSPLNFLNEQENRLSYLAAFSTCAVTMIDLILNDSKFNWEQGTTPYTKSLCKYKLEFTESFRGFKEEGE